jgi:hypothetical protein
MDYAQGRPAACVSGVSPAHRAARTAALHHLRSPQVVQMDDSQERSVTINNHE